LFISILSGLVAGTAHVITGPDHLAALAPMAADKPTRAAALGLRWGLGHGVGVIILGCLGIFARGWINVEALSAYSEFIVGFVLIFVGLWALLRATRMVVHTHDHVHGQQHTREHGHADHHTHSHFHVHASASNHDSAEAHRGHSHAAFAVGFLHGAAGTGHLLGVVPSLALPPLEASIYLVAYFVAAVLSMTGFGGLVGLISRHRGPKMLRGVMYTASSAAIVIGAFWVNQSWPA
jgi:hypothetical protein